MRQRTIAHDCSAYCRPEAGEHCILGYNDSTDAAEALAVLRINMLAQGGAWPVRLEPAPEAPPYDPAIARGDGVYDDPHADYPQAWLVYWVPLPGVRVVPLTPADQGAWP